MSKAIYLWTLLLGLEYCFTILCLLQDLQDFIKHSTEYKLYNQIIYKECLFGYSKYISLSKCYLTIFTCSLEIFTYLWHFLISFSYQILFLKKECFCFQHDLHFIKFWFQQPRLPRNIYIKHIFPVHKSPGIFCGIETSSCLVAMAKSRDSFPFLWNIRPHTTTSITTVTSQ